MTVEKAPVGGHQKFVTSSPDEFRIFRVGGREVTKEELRAWRESELKKAFGAGKKETPHDQK